MYLLRGQWSALTEQPLTSNLASLVKPQCFLQYWYQSILTAKIELYRCARPAYCILFGHYPWNESKDQLGLASLHTNSRLLTEFENGKPILYQIGSNNLKSWSFCEPNWRIRPISSGASPLGIFWLESLPGLLAFTSPDDVSLVFHSELNACVSGPGSRMKFVSILLLLALVSVNAKKHKKNKNPGKRSKYWTVLQGVRPSFNCLQKFWIPRCLAVSIDFPFITLQEMSRFQFSFYSPSSRDE